MSINFQIILEILFIILIFTAIIMIILFIKNYRKNRLTLRGMDIEELFTDLKAVISLRFRGRISAKEYNNKKEELLTKNKSVRVILDKINNFDYLNRYLSPVSKLNDCVLISSRGKIKFASKVFFDLLSYSKKETAAKEITDIIYQDDLNKFRYYLSGVDSGNSNSSNNIIRVLTKDGDIKWFETHAVSISEGDNYVFFLKDITKIAKAEDELFDALSRYHVLFDYSPTPIVEIDISKINDNINELRDMEISDLDNFLFKNQQLLFQWIDSIKVINANRAVYDFFGIEQKNNVTGCLLEFIRDELKEEIIEIAVSITENKTTYNSEFTFTNSADEEKHLILKFTIINNNGKKNSRALMSFMDITEQKNMINEIQDLSIFQESVIYNANIWLNVYDNDLNVLVWNKAAELISGYNKKEVINNNRIWKKLYPEEAVRQEVMDRLRNISVPDSNGGIDEFETKIKCKDKKEKIILWNVKKFINEEGNKIGLIIIGYDYTDKRNMENELKYMATHDALTHLYNRAFFEAQLNLMFKERKSKVGIIVLDIDGLKYVNDTLGHQEGDKLITSVAGVLSKTFRPSDIVSRIGGDEFSILLRDIDEKGVRKILERLLKKIDKYNQNKKTTRYPMNVSFGYAIRNNGKNALQVFKRADDMLFNKKLQRKDSVIRSALSAIKATMLEKDSITEEHMERLKIIANNFADAVGLNSDDKRKLVLATELHDIGKVIISDEILNKDSTLNSDEFDMIKKHSESGYRIAKLTPTISHVSKFILHAHERWDGSGYPKGLKEDGIPLISRMVHIIDAYDVMINDRPYKKAVNKEAAINELKRCGGTQFDPDLVGIFIKDVLKSSYKKLVDSRI